MDTIENRLPPHDAEAEEAVLGSLLIDPSALYEIEHFLRAADFYRTTNRWVYEAILGLRSAASSIDVLTVSSELRRREQLEDVGGEGAVITLLNAVPTSINVEAYARLVHDAAVRREMLAAAGRIAKAAYDETRSVDAVVAEAEQSLFAATAGMTADGVVSARDIFDALLDVTGERRDAGGPVIGLPSGLMDLDRVLGGYKKSDLIFVAGRPGMGKTSFVTTNLTHICGKLGKRAAMFTLEMSSEQLARRLACQETGVDYQALERGQLSDDEWLRFMSAAGRLATWSLWIDDTPALAPTQLSSKARRLYAEHGLDIIFIDYIGLMDSDGQAWSENDRIGRISRSLKRLAKELDIPVVCLAQLSRTVESRQEKRPQLADLRDSGSLEQDSDVVLFLYRDDYYNKASERPGVAEAIVAKHRNGSTGSVDLYWNARLAAFRNLAVHEVNL